MRLLLDTHAFVWALLDDDRLSREGRAAIEAPAAEVEISGASIWEIAIKVGLGKWPAAEHVLDDVEVHLVRLQFSLLPISVTHVRAAGLLASPHRDPFDRLLAAQA